MDPDAEAQPNDTPEESSEAANVANFMASRPPPEETSDDDETEVAAALEQAALDRQNRRRAAARSTRAVAAIVQRAESAIANGRHMDAIGLYTEALAVEPDNVELLSQRGLLCARLNHHKATLHDGELIIKKLPDSHQGHQLCGMALFCLKQYAPACRAYRRAIELAPADGRGGLSEALAQAQGKVDEELRQAVIKEDLSELKRLLFGGAGGAELTTAHSAVALEAREPSHGFTALALGTFAGRTESVRMLLSAKAEPDARDKFGKTALMWAASAGNEKLATLLWKGGASLDAQDKVGWDALFAAAHGGHVRLVTVWMQKADLERQTADGTTCLMAAAQAGHAPVVRMLLTRKADPNRANGKGQRALELATAGKHDETVALLQPVTAEGAGAAAKATTP